MNLHFPGDIHHFILFQRTQYLRRWENKYFRMFTTLMPFLSYEKYVKKEAKTDQPRIEYMYKRDILDDFDMIRPYIPYNTKNILDIGCGVAGIDILLYHHFRVNDPNICLLDKTHMEHRVFYDFKPKGAFYNSLQKAREFMQINGVPKEHIKIQEATDDNAVNFDKLDLVISLISWGFHYPLETYLDKVIPKLNKEGRIIVDVRQGTSGTALLGRNFQSLTVIHETSSYQRIVASSPAKAQRGIRR